MDLARPCQVIGMGSGSCLSLSASLGGPLQENPEYFSWDFCGSRDRFKPEGIRETLLATPVL